MNTTRELIRIGRETEEQATATVLAAFADDPMAATLGLSETTMEKMYGLPVRLGLHAGEVYATAEAAEGVMIIVKSENANFGFAEIARVGSLRMALGLGRLLLNRHMRRMFTTLEADQKTLDIGPYLYLSMLAVSPEHQGKGHGGRLLRYLCDRADREERAVYLETQNESNVSLYQHFGFEVVKHLVVTEGVEMWEMVRPRA